MIKLESLITINENRISSLAVSLQKCPKNIKYLIPPFAGDSLACSLDPSLKTTDVRHSTTSQLEGPGFDSQLGVESFCVGFTCSLQVDSHVSGLDQRPELELVPGGAAHSVGFSGRNYTKYTPI